MLDHQVADDSQEGDLVLADGPLPHLQLVRADLVQGEEIVDKGGIAREEYVVDQRDEIAESVGRLSVMQNSQKVRKAEIVEFRLVVKFWANLGKGSKGKNVLFFLFLIKLKVPH